MYILARLASALVTHLFLPCADAMLGKGKLVELRAIARSHKLAAGSQTVPNSVVEIAISQGKPPPRGPTPSGALPAQERKKLALKRPKRKTPQVVSEEEVDDEATEDGLITKRKRVHSTRTSNANTATTSRSVGNSPSNITGHRAHSDREWDR